MPTDPKRRNRQALSAEISLVHLNNCLVNLPEYLCSLLSSVNSLAQNVIVELNYSCHESGYNSKNDAQTLKSVYVGWTGMQSTHKLSSVVKKNGISGMKSNFIEGGEVGQEVPLIELDYNFARTLEISDGQKVTASLHLDPPIALVVNIEPLTAEDWDLIEFHAQFLELNLISQIRALPNPTYIPQDGRKPPPVHPLTLRLSPSSTANIRITSLTPEPPSSSPFAKLDPSAEVIVAPKTRLKPSFSHVENQSNTSKKSANGRRKSDRQEAWQALYFRGVEKNISQEWFENKEEDSETEYLRVWIDRDVIISKGLKEVTWVLVSILKPASLQAPIDPQKRLQEDENSGTVGPRASKLIARLLPWENPPDNQHIALSASLCASLACKGIVGGVVRLVPAPQQVPKNVSPIIKVDESQVLKPGFRLIKIYPFSSEINKESEGLKFGGESKTEAEEAAKRIMKVFGGQTGNQSLLDGPITDGMVLGKEMVPSPWSGWEGAIIRFDYNSATSKAETCRWFLGSERKHVLRVQPPVPCPRLAHIVNSLTEPISKKIPTIVGIDDLIDQVHNNLLHLSSALLTGAQGSGKSSLAQLLAHRLRKDYFFHTTLFSCQLVITNESRVSTIKDTLNQIFLSASWGVRLGGRSLIIFDDLDKLCPAETELETSENGRSRQISEGLCMMVRKYCNASSGIVLLATTEAKESLHNVIIGGHVFRETFALKTPSKEGRRKILEIVTQQNLCDEGRKNRTESRYKSDTRPTTAVSITNKSTESWMESSTEVNHEEFSGEKGCSSFIVSPDLDFLDLASETDGYMPGDLVLLVTRTRSEAIIRVVTEQPKNTWNAIEITREDFTRAMKDLTPASLRNVKLQKSTSTFDSIGGLHTTRQILLETLQYPTIYAPIFAQCPLRLRSGILLYGYPGCGKTILASVVAGEFGLNFISVKGPEILDKYIGASEKSVRDLFERAEAAKPCILFFDEFDSIAPKRGHDSTGVTDRVVNQILTQMDGAEGLSGVYVLAATSRPDLIDPALLRPGRLDKSLICDLPNMTDRIDILSVLSSKLKLSHEARKNFSEIASRTEGYSGADLQALMYNAHLESIHEFIGDQNEFGIGKTISKNKDQLSKRKPDYVQFLYGEDEQRLETERCDRVGTNKSKILAEKMAISSKLAEIRTQKSKFKMRTIPGDDEFVQKEHKLRQQETIIEWRHLEKSLSTTKASISADERNRLATIYQEFLTSRDGKVRSGDGGREVGGRVSLM